MLFRGYSVADSPLSSEDRMTSDAGVGRDRSKGLVRRTARQSGGTWRQLPKRMNLHLPASSRPVVSGSNVSAIWQPRLAG